MDIETFRSYCLSKKAVSECFPFDEHTLVFKVMNKMFALLPLDETEPRANLKADPALAIEWREKYHQVSPGWHMNKMHWNTVRLEEGLGDDVIRQMIDHSYEKVIDGFTGKMKEAYRTL